MMKYLKILSAALLIALAGGCGDSNEEIEDNIPGPAFAYLCFIDSEGQDLLTGIHPVKWVTPTVEYTGDFVADSDLHIKKLAINDREIQVEPVSHVGLGSEGFYTSLPYKSISFIIGIQQEIDEAYSDIVYTVTVYTVRWEIIFPYIFGNDEVHTLTGELCVTSGKAFWFQKCWFDSVEASPAYFEWASSADKKPNAFLVRVDK
jgi:hypothetical protein